MHKIKGSVSEEVWLACHSPGSRILNALERKAADLILWRLSCLIHHDGNWPKISSCYFGLFYCDYCNILCFVLTSILFCFALVFFLQNNPHTYIPLFLGRLITWTSFQCCHTIHTPSIINFSEIKWPYYYLINDINIWAQCISNCFIQPTNPTVS